MYTVDLSLHLHLGLYLILGHRLYFTKLFPQCGVFLFKFYQYSVGLDPVGKLVPDHLLGFFQLGSERVSRHVGDVICISQGCSLVLC